MTALYEGIIDRKGLSPMQGLGLSSAPLPLPEPAPASGTRSHPQSAFTPTAPLLAMQKTYVLPRVAVALQHTVSAAGIANKNLLVAFANGQIYSIGE